jgi:hypothetical protein
MKLTNKRNLPDAFFQAVKNDGYSRGDADLSVTQAIDSPQVVELTRQNWDKLEEDVEDRVWSLFGQVTHGILERANVHAVAERRLTIEIEGWKVSGGMDLYDIDGTLTDYKTTSAWSLIFDGVEKWEKQLNCYAVLLRRHGHKVEKLQVVAMLRDWQRSRAQDDPTYPQSMVVNVDIPLWAPEIAEKYLRERVILHKQARLTGQWSPCTAKERWERGEKWAVKKIGGKVAVRGGLFDSEAEAKAFVGFDKNLYVEHRPGVPGRCLNYCAVKSFCPQAQGSGQDSSPQPSDDSGEVKTAV